MKLSVAPILCSIVLLSIPTRALEKLAPPAADEIRSSLRRLEAVASLEGSADVNKAWLAELRAQHLSTIERLLDCNGITYPTPKTTPRLSLI